MKKLKKLTSLLFLFCCLCFCLILFPQTARAGSLTPTAQDNLNVRLRRTSDLIPVSGGYMRVFHQKNSVGVEYYDNDLKIRSKRKINMELPLWGGFYAGSDGYYPHHCLMLHRSRSHSLQFLPGLPCTWHIHYRGCHLRDAHS